MSDLPERALYSDNMAKGTLESLWPLPLGNYNVGVNMNSSADASVRIGPW